MNSLKDLFEQKNMGQTVLAILFVIYLIMGYETPDSLNEIIDSTYGKVAVVVLALVLFSFANPVLGVLGFLVAYMLITRASVSTGSYAVQHYIPTEKKKYSTMTKNNQFPYTLEQEIVKKMAPVNKHNSTDSAAYSFKPMLDDLHDAAPIDYKGVI
jgi:hypothetical protein